jgi:hydroxyacid-oxoacid transhydrogenase
MRSGMRSLLRFSAARSVETRSGMALLQSSRRGLSGLTRASPPTLQSFPYHVPLSTRWADTDAYAHVNNAHYYSLFDTAVNTFLIRECGAPPPGAASGVAPLGFVVASRCDFFRPLSFPASLTAGVRVADVGRSSVTYDFALFDDKGDACAAAGSYTHVFVEGATRRPVAALPAPLAAGLARHRGAAAPAPRRAFSTHRRAFSALAARALMSGVGGGACPWHGAGCSGLHGAAAATAPPPAATDYAFEMAASTIRFGAGCTREVGHDVAAALAGARARAGGAPARVLVMSDSTIAAMRGGPLARVLDALSAAGVAGDAVHVFTDVTVEPTDASFARAAAAAAALAPAAYVAVGGGSVIDTAKAANLYASHPGADFLDFVNAPVGRGLPVPPGSLRPLFAVPTTAGTGSETTGVAIFDHAASGAKTGIASRVLKPALGLVDPDNTLSAPRGVAVASGFDVLCHALEAYTALPFDARAPRPATPAARPAYQGANPMSDVWAAHALRLVARNFVRACNDRGDAAANAAMTLAAAAAGIGFGNAGVHLAHACSYGVSRLSRGYAHADYARGKPLVPHGIAVVLPAPAVFRATAAACPERTAECAAILRGEDVPVAFYAYGGGAPAGARTRRADDAGRALADELRRYMRALDVPDGLRAVGITPADVPALVEATLPQRRVLDIAPDAALTTREGLARIFEDSLSVY